MAKKKDAAALFEVISKSRDRCAKDGLNVPPWMRTHGESVELPAVEQGPAVEQQPVAELQPETPMVPAPHATFEAGPAESEPMVSTIGGRLRLSLNYVSCTVIFVALLVLLIGSFVLGRLSVGGSGAAHTAEIGKLPQQNTGKQAPPEPPAKDARIPGKYYLVIQNMQGLNDELKAEAYKIRDFCKAQDRPATINEWRGSYIVWSMAPFETSGGLDARQFALEMERLGRQYLAQGGKYNFMQRRSPGGLLEPMFIRYAVP